MVKIENGYNHEKARDIRKMLKLNGGDYEIQIDGHKVIQRTNSIDKFFDYEQFMSNRTQSITIITYYGKSRRGIKTIFKIAGDAEGLGSLDEQPESKEEMKNQIYAEIKAEFDAQKRDEEIAELREEVKKKNSIVGALEGFAPILVEAAAENPKVQGLLEKALGGSSNAELGGLQLSEEDQQWLNFRAELQQIFSEDELNLILNFISACTENKALLMKIVPNKKQGKSRRNRSRDRRHNQRQNRRTQKNTEFQNKPQDEGQNQETDGIESTEAEE